MGQEVIRESCRHRMEWRSMRWKIIKGGREEMENVYVKVSNDKRRDEKDNLRRWKGKVPYVENFKKDEANVCDHGRIGRGG